MTTIDYHVVSPRGATLYTSPDKDLARRWARDRSDALPGITVEEVIVTTQRRRVYRPSLRLVGA